VEFAMMFAAALTGRTSEFEVFRCDFDSIVNAGVPSAEEMKANQEAYKTGEISLETLRSKNGIEDTDSENVKVKSEEGYELNQLKNALEIHALSNNAVPLRTIIQLMPIDEEKKNLIINSLETVPPPSPAPNDPPELLN
jgi:hypothetical protein